MRRGVRAGVAAVRGPMTGRYSAVSLGCRAAMAAVAAVLGFGTGIAIAAPDPAPAPAAPGLLPETGSAAVHNDLMCRLRIVWAAAPCRYT